MRRPWLRTVIGMVVAAVSTGLLAGCITGPSQRDEAAAQEQIRTALIRQLEALPGATITAAIQSGLDTGQNNVGAQARLPGEANESQTNVMADIIERTIWLSHLDPLGSISISFYRPGSNVRVLQRLYIGDDKDALGVKYGPRPDGLTGY